MKCPSPTDTSDFWKSRYQRLSFLNEYGVDLEDRSIFVLGEIDSPMTEYISNGIHMMQDLEDPIYMYINSPGGYDDSLFYLYDAMNLSCAPIHTQVIGMACSAASLILAAGSYRYATENAHCMVHKGRSVIAGDDDEITSSAAMTKSYAELYWALFARHTKHSAKWWYEHARDGGQLWLNSKEMLNRGVVDEIVKPARRMKKIQRMKLGAGK